jgi:hypothetical protein
MWLMGDAFDRRSRQNIWGGGDANADRNQGEVAHNFHDGGIELLLDALCSSRSSVVDSSEGIACSCDEEEGYDPT